jgi:predicted NUDIX family NTP pyrophosphohydrolase
MTKRKQDKVGVTFEVRNNVRQLDGVRMPLPMPDGWYWSYDDLTAWSIPHGPFPDCITAGYVMAMATQEGSLLC